MSLRLHWYLPDIPGKNLSSSETLQLHLLNCIHTTRCLLYLFIHTDTNRPHSKHLFPCINNSGHCLEQDLSSSTTTQLGKQTTFILILSIYIQRPIIIRKSYPHSTDWDICSVSTEAHPCWTLYLLYTLVNTVALSLCYNYLLAYQFLNKNKHIVRVYAFIRVYRSPVKEELARFITVKLTFLLSGMTRVTKLTYITIIMKFMTQYPVYYSSNLVRFKLEIYYWIYPRFEVRGDASFRQGVWRSQGRSGSTAKS